MKTSQPEKRGIQLTEAERRLILKHLSNRYTCEHMPMWVTDFAVKHGQLYPVQFLSDKDFLVHSFYPVTAEGKLDIGAGFACRMEPTFPFGNKMTNIHMH